MLENMELGKIGMRRGTKITVSGRKLSALLQNSGVYWEREYESNGFFDMHLMVVCSQHN